MSYYNIQNMYKIITTVGWLLLSVVLLQAQVTPANFNLTQVGQLSYTQNLNDIWGYVDGQGTEYALVGTKTGTSIVSLADPANPNEILFIPGGNSIWRDLKTWGNHAFVTTEAKDGLLVIDLSPLPNGTPTYYFWKPSLTVNGDNKQLQSVHNLYIDEHGYCYLAGSNINVGETIILDVHTNPDTPSYVGTTNPFYAHDAYARGDTLWTSDINNGHFSVYDVSNHASPVLLAQQTTPRNFAHNAWISDDGNSLFTTDEKSNAWIGSFDVSDVNNIKEIDRYRTPTPNTIPHNTHTFNDYQVISYYTDGLIILDNSRPDNLIEVGRYDTYNGTPSTGFHGAWGAYPYLPSGLILVSDINTGLHILRPTYQRGCWLEGIVTDQNTSAPIFGTDVEILTQNITDQSRLNGDYRTGIGMAGTYQVRFSKAGYVSQTFTVTLSNGVVTTQNVQLVPAIPYRLTGQVVQQNTTNGIPNAKVWLKSLLYEYTTTADASGNFALTIFPDDDYTVVAGKWGYREGSFNVPGLDSNTATGRTYPITIGYKDDFVFDYNWTESGSASSGKWEHGVPEQINAWNGTVLPSEGDLAGDIGNGCLITGNNGNGINGADDISNGYTRITSPVMDLTTYNIPMLSFHYFMNVPWPPSGEDSLSVHMTNGVDTVLIWSTITPNYVWSSQKRFRIEDYITITNNMRVYFEANDGGRPTIVEALIDAFEIRDSSNISVVPVERPKVALQAYPNPFAQQLQVVYAIHNNPNSLPPVIVYNSLGQIVEVRQLTQPAGTIQVGERLTPGVYFVHIGNQTLSIVKRQP